MAFPPHLSFLSLLEWCGHPCLMGLQRGPLLSFASRLVAPSVSKPINSHCFLWGLRPERDGARFGFILAFCRIYMKGEPIAPGWLRGTVLQPRTTPHKAPLNCFKLKDAAIEQASGQSCLAAFYRATKQWNFWGAPRSKMWLKWDLLVLEGLNCRCTKVHLVRESNECKCLVISGRRIGDLQLKQVFVSRG